MSLILPPYFFIRRNCFGRGCNAILSKTLSTQFLSLLSLKKHVKSRDIQSQRRDVSTMHYGRHYVFLLMCSNVLAPNTKCGIKVKNIILVSSCHKTFLHILFIRFGQTVVIHVLFQQTSIGEASR